MRLIHDVKGISKLILIILLLISFIIGALLSYIWTMGGYAPSEFHLPSQANITIESAEFYAENATFFNVTLLNPSSSSSPVQIEQIMVATDDGLLHQATGILPALPHELAPGNSQTFKAYWNWANYTGQTVNVIASVEEGTGSTSKANTPFMSLTIASVNFDPSVSATNFTVTVQSTGSQTFMDITRVTLNGEDIVVSPLLPYTLNVDASATFTLAQEWSDLQGTNVTVSVETLQGFVAHKSQVVPEVLKVSSSDIVFNANYTDRFSLVVQNVATPQTSLNISQIIVNIRGETVIIEGANVTPPLPYTLQPDSQIQLMCAWNWINYQGKSATATFTVYTEQGFSKSAEASIP